MIPENATSKVIAPGVRLYDVSALLPVHSERKYQARKHPIDRVFVHHSGRLGRPGFEGARNSTRYVVEQRNFPGAPYHFWIPANDERDESGDLVVYRLQPSDVACWHSGGHANQTGLGVALQGNTTSKPLTAHHVECLEALLPWLAITHQLDYGWLSWHAEAARYGGRNKAACPGKHAVKWLEEYRESAYA